MATKCQLRHTEFDMKKKEENPKVTVILHIQIETFKFILFNLNPKKK